MDKIKLENNLRILFHYNNYITSTLNQRLL